MGKDKGRETDQTTQCKHSTSRNTLACHSNSNKCNNHSNSNNCNNRRRRRSSSSSNRSNAHVVTGTRTTVVEKTTAGALKLTELVLEGQLLFLVINVNDHATEFIFVNVHGCRRLRRRHHVRDCCADC